MIKISKKADYAVLIMASLAAHEAAAAANSAGTDAPHLSAQEHLSAQGIADENSLSRPLCANLLKSLTRAGLLESLRGAGGGYRLARPSAAINLAQILEAVEGPIRLVECAVPTKPSSGVHCSLSEHCPSRSAMRVVHSRIARLMEEILLPELLEHEHRGSLAGVVPAREPS